MGALLVCVCPSQSCALDDELVGPEALNCRSLGICGSPQGDIWGAIPSNDRTFHGRKSAPDIDRVNRICDNRLMTTSHQKIWAVRQMMKQPDAWDRESEALEIAYSIDEESIREKALKVIADRMCDS